jgi:hypothetical protein
LLLWVAEGPSPCTPNWTALPSPVVSPSDTAGGGVTRRHPPSSITAADVSQELQLERAGPNVPSRPAFIHLHHFGDGSELLIYYGDDWNVGGAGGVGNATYVWLPLVQAGKPGSRALQLKMLESWKVGDYRSTSGKST